MVMEGGTYTLTHTQTHMVYIVIYRNRKFASCDAS